MVNTFLVCVNYRQSAACLDNLRLNKQGTEALEVVYAILNLQIVSHYFGWTIPEETQLWKSWVSQLVTHYVSLPYRLVVDDSGAVIGQIQVLPGSTATDIPRKAGEGRVVRLSPRPAHHPVTRAWLLWVDALKEYYNAHILEWISRGKNNTRPLFPVPENSSRPPWSLDPNWHQMCRACLLNKELNPKPRKDGRQRKDVVWYRASEAFISAGPFHEYWWPY